jgi:hypothetical protein
VNPPPASSHPSAKGKAVPEPLKVSQFIIKLFTKTDFEICCSGGNETD